MRLQDENGNFVYYGKYRGIVTDNNDPQKMGRIRAKVSEVLGDIICDWAFPSAPYGGFSDTGIFFIPELGSGVFIEFESGDVNRPLWTGVWWAKPNDSSNEVPIKAQNPYQQVKIIRTKAGHHIKWDDSTGEIEIASPDNLTFYQIKNGSLIVNSTATIQETSGTTKTEIVGTNKTETVGLNKIETIGANKTETITANKIETVLGTKTETVTGASQSISLAINTVSGNLGVSIISATAVTVTAPSVLLGSPAASLTIMTEAAIAKYNTHRHGGSAVPDGSYLLVPGIDTTLITKAM